MVGPGRAGAPWWPRIRSFVFAVALVLATVALRGALGVEYVLRPLMILFILPIIVSAYLGGLGAGLLATALSAILIDILWIPHAGAFGFSAGHDLVQWLIFVADGALISVLVMALHRRTGELKAELDARLRAEEALRRSRRMEDRLHAVIERQAEMVTLRDAEGRLLYTSPATERIVGYGAEELRGMAFADIIHPDDRPAALEAFRSLRPGDTASGLTLRVRAKDGRWHWLEGSISNFLGDGAVAAVVSNFRDVGERHELQAQLAHAVKMEGIGLLAGGIAHDFNNIIAVINGYGELALGGMSPVDPHREAVAQMLDASKRAATLTRQLLAFSRRQVLMPRVLDLNAAVEDMGAMLTRVLGEDIEISVSPAPALDSVLIDPGQLEQILLNLAVNARDAMPGGGKLTIETGNVELDADYTRKHADGQPGPHVMLAVTDTGHGMDAATLARIFEPFFTTKEVGQGTGLGLSMVYGIVKQSGGNIWVYSEPGVGTTFKIYLPKAQGAAAAAAIPPPPAVERGHESILLVEDDVSLRKLFRIMLSGAGYKVTDTGDPQEALALCRRPDLAFHLLLTDMIMPKMGGRKLAEQAQALRPGLRVAFMSGYTDDALIHQGGFGPGTSFIEKPVGREELLRKVREFLAPGAGEAS